MSTPGKKSGNNSKRKSSASLIKNNKGLELTVAALLLTGKLRVDSIQMFNDASVVVGLVGKYKTLGDLGNNNVDKLVNFMNENSGMTINDLFEAVGKKMNNKN